MTTNQYETVAGTPAQPHVEHEPRTIQRRHDTNLYMMTEIGDGVFVQWMTCRQCSKSVGDCTCPGGPAEPEYMTRWRDKRFKHELNQRPDPSHNLLPSVISWVKGRGCLVLERGDLSDLTDATQEAMDAAYRDSNDDEIDLLRGALEEAYRLLGLGPLPDGRDPDDEDAPEQDSLSDADAAEAPAEDERDNAPDPTNRLQGRDFNVDF